MKIQSVKYGAFLKKSFNIFLQNWTFFVIFLCIAIGIELILGVLEFIADQVQGPLEIFTIIIYFIAALAAWYFSMTIGIGFLRGLLGCVRGVKPTAKVILNGHKPFKVVLYSFLLGILMSFSFFPLVAWCIGFWLYDMNVGMPDGTLLVAVIGGILLFVFALYLVAFRWVFAQYIVIDRGVDPIESLRLSWKYSQGNVWHLLVFVLISLGLLVLSVFTLFIGLIFLIPTLTVLYVLFYKNLADFHDNQEVGGMETSINSASGVSSESS